MLTLPNSEKWRFRFRSPTQKCNDGTTSIPRYIKNDISYMIRHEKKASCVLVKHHLNFFSPWGILSINFASKPPAKHLWVPETEMLLGSNPRETLPGSFWVTWLSWNGWSLRWLSTVSTVTWTHNTNTDFAKHSTTNSTCHIYIWCVYKDTYI